MPDKVLQKHAGDPKMWSYACRCLRCAWQAWWNEADDDVIPMPNEPDPDGEFKSYWDAREFWRNHGHHPNS